LAQNRQVLGSFEKPQQIKRYPNGTSIVFYDDGSESNVLAMTVAGPEQVLIFRFDSAYHPTGIVEVPVPQDKSYSKDLDLSAHYTSEGSHHILLRRTLRFESGAAKDTQEEFGYTVLSYDPIQQTHSIKPLSPLPQVGERRKMLGVFSHQESFWLLTAHGAEQALELHRYRGAELVDSRTIKLEKDHFRAFTRSSNDRPGSELEVWFTDTPIRHVPERTYDFQLGVLADELVLIRSFATPKESTLPMVRFGIDTRRATLDQLPLDEGQLPEGLSYVTFYDNRIVLCHVSQQRLHLQLRKPEAPGTVERQRILYSTGSLVRTLRQNGQEGGRTVLPFVRNKNPFYDVGTSTNVRPFVYAYYSTYCFSGAKGEMILGLAAKRIMVSASTASNPGGSSTQLSTLALPLDPQSLELLSEPNGPHVSDLQRYRDAQERLTRGKRLLVKAKRLLPDGSMVVLAQDLSSDAVGVFKLRP